MLFVWGAEAPFGSQDPRGADGVEVGRARKGEFQCLLQQENSWGAKY